MKIENAIKILIEDSDKHFDRKYVDIFLATSADKIIEVFLTDSELTLSETDKAVLSSHKLLDIRTLLTLEEGIPLSADEVEFINAFSRYYEERV